MRQTHRAALHGVFDAANDQFCTQFRSAKVAEIRHFMEVVAGVDHQQRVRNLAGFGIAVVAQKRLFSAFQQHQRVFAARKQQGRALKGGGHFAQDEDGFLFQRVQMGVAQMHVGEVQIRQVFAREFFGSCIHKFVLFNIQNSLFNLLYSLVPHFEKGEVLVVGLKSMSISPQRRNLCNLSIRRHMQAHIPSPPHPPTTSAQRGNPHPN